MVCLLWFGYICGELRARRVTHFHRPHYYWNLTLHKDRVEPYRQPIIRYTCRVLKQDSSEFSVYVFNLICVRTVILCIYILYAYIYSAGQVLILGSDHESEYTEEKCFQLVRAMMFAFMKKYIKNNLVQKFSLSFRISKYVNAKRNDGHSNIIKWYYALIVRKS